MRTARRIIALLLTLCMFFALGACGKTKTDTSSDSLISSDIVSEGTPSADVNDSSSQSSDTVSGDKASSSQPTASKNEAGIDMETLRGKTVDILMWREFTPDEASRVAKFEKETGIKVKAEVATFDSYTAKLASKVSANESPDLATIQLDVKYQGAFPLGVASLFQPVTVTKQDLSDGKIWDLATMEQLKLKGKYYSLIANNAWYNCGAIIMYNDDILTKCGAHKPYDLWKAGKWNWDTLKSVAQTVYDYGKTSGNNYSGIGQITANSPAFGTYLLQSIGADYVSYDGEKFANTITDSKVIKAWTFHAQLMESKAYDNTATANDFFSQKLGLYSTNIYAMKKENGMGQIELCKFNVNIVPFPSPAGEETILPTGPNAFGIPKGAKDPVAAGVFLKYFVDPANGPDYVTASGNAASKDVFEYLSNPNTNKKVTLASGALGYTNLSNLNKLTSALAVSSSGQVTTILQQYKSFTNNAVEKINKVIAK